MKKDRYAHIAKQYKEGHCYQNAVRYLEDNDHNEHLRLVHGWITGKGQIEGVRYSHAWIEDLQTGMCIDPSVRPESPLIFPRLAYYHLAQINAERLLFYTVEETFINLCKFGTYGPWDTRYDE